MLENLITSKTRVKLLLKFFLNPESKSYLRGLASEFGESTNSVRIELNRFKNANMILSENEGNKKFFKVNKAHPLYREINGIVHKYFELDVVVDRIISQIGNLERAYVLGDMACGKDGNNIDLLLIGNTDKDYLDHLLGKVEGLLKRSISCVTLNSEEDIPSDVTEKLLIWSR